MMSILGMILGAGLFIGGLNLHDSDYRGDGRQLLVHSNGKEYLVNPSNNHREHWGYFMGTVGAACFALSLKHAWDQRGKSVSLSPNRARIHPGISRSMAAAQASRGPWRLGANLRLRFPREGSESAALASHFPVIVPDHCRLTRPVPQFLDLVQEPHAGPYERPPSVLGRIALGTTPRISGSPCRNSGCFDGKGGSRLDPASASTERLDF